MVDDDDDDDDDEAVWAPEGGVEMYQSNAAFTPKAPGTRLYVDFVWRRAAAPRRFRCERAWNASMLLTLYGGVPPPPLSV